MPEPLRSATFAQSPPDFATSLASSDAPSGAVDQATAALPVAASPPASTTGSPAVARLVSEHSLLPRVSPECTDRAAELAKASAQLVIAAGALAAAGTIAPVALFIGASMAFGASLAQYRNCENDAADAREKPGSS